MFIPPPAKMAATPRPMLSLWRGEIRRPIGVGWRPKSEILNEVAERHDLAPEAIRGPRRFKRFVIARQEAFAVMHAAGWSYPNIGRFFQRDHTSVLHGVRRHIARWASRETGTMNRRATVNESLTGAAP